MHVIAEYDLQGNLLRENIYTDYIDEVINIKEGTNQYYPIQDGSNSVVAILDSDGNMISDYNYEVFGTIKNKTEGIENNILYTGREFERETGDYFYRARYYNAASGRFLSEDPIGFESGDFNFYRYVGNGAVNKNDAFGLWNINYDNGFISITLKPLNPWSKKHTERNKNNHCPSKAPCKDERGQYIDCFGYKWLKDNLNIFHLPLKSFRGLEDKFRNSQCSYNSNDNLVPEDGTYDYSSPSDILGHLEDDVIPHLFNPKYKKKLTIINYCN